MMTITPTFTHNTLNRPIAPTNNISLNPSSSVTSPANPRTLQPSTIALVAGILLIAILAVLIISSIVLLWNCQRKSRAKLELQGGLYSTVYRGRNQPQVSILPAAASANVYEQVHLNPSSGQTDIIPTAEGETTSRSSTSQPQPDFHPIYSSVDIEQSQPLHQATQPVIVSRQSVEENISEGHTYAVVEKGRKRNQEQLKEDDSGDEGPPVPPYNPLNLSITSEEASAIVTTDSRQQGQETLEEIYANINKRPKMGEEEIAPPPIPPHSIEELYTAVKKNPTAEAVDDKAGVAISMKYNEAYRMASMPVDN